jgi:hypothetical protein
MKMSMLKNMFSKDRGKWFKREGKQYYWVLIWVQDKKKLEMVEVCRTSLAC